MAPDCGIHLRVALADGTQLGPGKAMLLERIAETGSIAAAGRSLGMSYKRAWYLVDTLNSYFNAPLVVSTKGGKAGGGAALTPLGQEVLTTFRRMEAAAEAAVRTDIDRLRGLVAG